MGKPFVVIAGATGGLGQLVASERSKRGVRVRALMRYTTETPCIEKLRSADVTIVLAD
jgi:uncharacterized protein YbjT (DUF2867 family)